MESKGKGGAGALLALTAVVVALLVFRRLWVWALIALGVLAVGFFLLLALLSHHYKKVKSRTAPAGSPGGPPPSVLRHYYNIRDAGIRELLRAIDDQHRKMLRTVADDPRDRAAADRFLRTALTGACRIAEGYAQLEKAPPGAHEAEAAKARAAETLRSIASAFAQQNARLFSNDVLRLEVETEVLEKTLRAQGYRPAADEPPAPGKESRHEPESES